MEELNEALLWLAERQGRISFSVDLHDRLNSADPPTPTVVVEAISVTAQEAEEGAECEPCYASAQITAGNIVGALLAAINKARGDEAGSDEMVDEGDPNTD